MKKTMFIFLALGSFLQANVPWFTGSLIAPTGFVIPYGRFMIKPHIPCIVNTGDYDANWQAVSGQDFLNVNPQLLCYFGLTPWCDINIVPQIFYQHTAGENDVQFGDLIVGLDFQLMAIDFTPYFPGIKFAIREVFPTGNYQQLRAKKMRTDLSGEGTFGTQALLILYKEFHIYRSIWLALNCSVEYTVNTPVHVQGFNSYGGGFGTKGTVLPGNVFQGILSFELSLSRNLALSIDNVYIHKDASEFFGNPGVDLTRGFAKVGPPSFEQLSFAYGLEYNWSADLGIVAGYWFSAMGRNSPKFQSGVVNLRYVY